MKAPAQKQARIHQGLASQDYLPTLDGWRAVAIISVLLCHGSTAMFDVRGTHPNSALYALTRYGALGVDVFFGISGFLICTRLLQERRNLGRISIKNFYIRRAFRILPPYLLYLVVLLLIAILGIYAIHPRDLLSCLFFFRNYIHGSWYTGHFWSLAVEEHFYLFWPLFLFLCGPRRARWVTVALSLAVSIWRVAEFRYGFVSHLLSNASFYERTDVRIDALFWGCWTALVMDVPGWRERLTRLLTPVAWLGLLLLFMFCVVKQVPFAMTWRSIIIPLLLVGTLVRPSWWLSRILELRPIRWIGRISYGLYLWQQLFLTSGSDFLPLLGPLQRFPLNFVALFAWASLSYYLLERPAIRTGHILSQGRPTVHTAKTSDTPVPMTGSAAIPANTSVSQTG